MTVKAYCVVVVMVTVSILDISQTPKGTHNWVLCMTCGDHTTALFCDTSFGANHKTHCTELGGTRYWLCSMMWPHRYSKNFLQENWTNSPESLSAAPHPPAQCRNQSAKEDASPSWNGSDGQSETAVACSNLALWSDSRSFVISLANSVAFETQKYQQQP